MTEVPSETFDDHESEEKPVVPPRSARLILVFECDRPSAGGRCFELDGVSSVTIGRGAEAGAARTSGSELSITVPAKALSTIHARLLREGETWIVEDAGSKNGTMVNGERVGRARLREGDVVEVGRTLFVLRSSIAGVPSAEAPAPMLATFVPELARTYREVARVAPSTIPLLLTGETGTGKEILARAVHAMSGRRGSFVAVNCAALTPTLLEAQLFGHVKGAFSGAARDEPGLVRAAEGGTLLLDEVGELPLPAQASLLRLLQEREVTPVGSSRVTTVDVRFLAATNRPLARAVANGSFRADLYARLCGLVVELPPLRARKEDLGLLVAEILRASGAPQVALTTAVGRAFLAHDWPFNIRELARVLGAATVLAAGSAIGLEHLPATLRTPSQVAAPPSSDHDDDERIHAALLASLRDHQGNVAAVARSLNKAPAQIHRWLKRFQIDLNSYRK